MAGLAHQLILFLIALSLNSECLVHAKPTSKPPVPTTNSTSSVLVIPGECEIFPPGECQPFTEDECTNDQQCQDIYLDYPGLKCCKNYCGIRVCDLPINIPAISVVSHEVKEPRVNYTTTFITYFEYVCPVDDQQFECPLEEDFAKECTQDSDCGQLYPGRDYKCCTDSCGDRYCEQPVSRMVRRWTSGTGLDG